MDLVEVSWGLKKANIDFEVVGISEIDKFAVQCYNQNFPFIKNYGDCKKINTKELPDFDLLTGGFPCQDVSIAGNRDLSKGRTNLYQEILRIASDKKPKYILLENVKGLLSMEIDDVRLVDKIVRDLKKIGYGVCYKVLNSKDYGIPQNRERIWFVCKLGGWEFMEFQFPYKEPLKLFLKDILEQEVDKKYYLTEKQVQRIIERNDNFNMKGTGFVSEKQDYFTGLTCNNTQNDILISNPRPKDFGFKDISPTLCQRDCKDPKLVCHSLFPRSDTSGKGGTGHLSKDDGTSYCLDTGNTQVIEIIGGLQKHQIVRKDNISPSLTSAMGLGGGQIPIMNRTRRLTPKECFRLMGFLNDEINLKGLSDTQCYRLAGNGWDVNLVSKIFKNMFQPSKSLNTWTN